MDILVKNLGKDNVKYLSLEYDSKALDYLNKYDFILRSISVVFKSLKKNFQAKKSFIVCLRVEKISDKEYEHVLKVWKRFEIKMMKYITTCTYVMMFY